MGQMNLPGMAVDHTGGPVVDPTKNVLDLVQAAVRRQDDLREMEGSHRHEVDQIRSEHAAVLRYTEAGRLDAIRAVDVNAVQRAAEVQATAASALAATVAASAEAMRTQVAAAATAAAGAQAVALEPITKAIEDLRRSQYESQGQKNQVVETGARSGNTAMWMAIGVSVAAMGSSLLLGLAGVAIALFGG